MRHNVSGKKLGRDASHRKALLRNLSTSLIESGSVTTTLAKAKYVKPYVEKLITKTRNGGLQAVRHAKTKLTREDMVRKLVDEVAPKFVDRAGGYTRIVKVGRRDGDNAEMARLELVVKEEKPVTKLGKKEASEQSEVADKKEASEQSEVADKKEKKSTKKAETGKEEAAEELVEEVKEEENDKE